MTPSLTNTAVYSSAVLWYVGHLPIYKHLFDLTNKHGP